MTSETEKKLQTLCPIMFRGKYSQSIREASQQERISKTHLTRLFKNPSIPDVYKLTNEI